MRNLADLFDWLVPRMSFVGTAAAIAGLATDVWCVYWIGIVLLLPLYVIMLVMLPGAIIVSSLKEAIVEAMKEERTAKKRLADR